MPYSVPSSPSTSSHSIPSTTAMTQASPRLSHRRTRSCGPSFSDEQGPGAFVSLGSLPKRKPTQKKAMFHFNEEHDQQEEVNDDSAPNSQQKSQPSLFLSLPSAQDSVPFPSSSLLSPLSPTEPRHSPEPLSTPIPRSSSSSIVLSNGKPLKSSLKSSTSSPHIPQITHLRAQSAPTTPNALKNVHFAESDDGLESVRVYKLSGKPANISRPAGDETETETEAEPSAFPFPQSPPPHPVLSPLPMIDSDRSTCLPNSSNPNANIYIESLSLPKCRPAAIHGFLLVRNVAFEKRVALRFTLDDWQTTSEVSCKHVSSLAHLPPPFPRSRTVGDAIGRLASGEACSQEFQWDRFSFVLPLELYEQKLTEHVLVFVGRYTAPGVGEWWDNNDGHNYRVSFKRPPPPSSPSQNRSFTAPSTMRPTPVTPSISVETSALSFPQISPVLPGPPSLTYTPTSPTTRKVSPVSQPDKTSCLPLAERRGIPGGVSLSQASQKSVSPPVRVASPIQTPTPPRSRSGSLEEISQPFALHPEPKPKNTSAPIFKDGIPMFTSPRSSPRSTPPRVASPLPPSLSCSANTSASSSSSSTPKNSRLSPTGPMSPLTTELPSSQLHEALVKQWCFAQSSPPTPGVFSRGNGSPVEDEPPAAKVSPPEKEKEASSGPAAWWTGNGTGTSGWFNWTSDNKSTTGQILGY
ncbi:putative phosphatase regulatory subunit-domain-containing protein [Thelephora terrestris]|uniref:Phosphatase regulatory subunit-domain-containing protein n=1 Tax=Thelephora terrestris TaxID=56493 RepID=A0A9P6H4C8_9AGAM|nr:putative phosphatase regulatory subunit-domain-containing protein [Thelephora terrestris]